MKAVFLLQTDPFEPKPALRALREADALGSAGWDVVFVSWVKEKVPPSARSRFPVIRIPFPVPPLGSSVLSRARAYGRATKALAAGVMSAQPDLIVAHDFEVLRAAVRARRATGAPVIYDSHEDWPALIAENSRFEARIASAVERRLCRRVAHVVTVSEPIAEKFHRIGCPCTVLYSARPSDEIVIANREDSRRAFGYRTDDFVVGFAGALGKGRGLEILLEAATRLPSGFKILIVGGPVAEAEALRRRADLMGLRDRVRIDDHRPFAELARYYAAMDLGVILLSPQPNHLRALPNKLFDYMAHGIPVLVPDYPSMSSIVRTGPVGWTVPEITVKAVTQAINEASDSVEARTRGAKGRDAFLREYAWNRQESKFLSIVSDIARLRDT